jgi:hypothetical protein
MKIGDKVLYHGIEYTVEIDYGNQVYAITDKVAFIDRVSGTELQHVDCITLGKFYNILYHGQTYFGQYWSDTSNGKYCFFIREPMVIFCFLPPEVAIMEAELSCRKVV